MMKRLLILGLACACGTATAVDDVEAIDAVGTQSCDYSQVLGNAAHSGNPCPDIARGAVIAVLPQDDDAAAIVRDFGFLRMHEGAPVVSGEWLIVPGHHGYAGNPFDRTSDRWRLTAYQSLQPRWTFESDWRPVDSAVKSLGYMTNGYVAMFGPAIAGGIIYAPAASGRLARIDLTTGAPISTIDPFANTAFSGDPRLVVNSSVTIAPDGSKYYTAVAWPTTPNPSRAELPRGAWLVHIRPNGTSRIVPWAQVASPQVGVPAATDLCEWQFGTAGSPPAIGPDSKPPLFQCGPQVPAMNAGPAIDPETGHIVVFSYGHLLPDAAFLIDVDPISLRPTQAHDTRGRSFHGCGVRLAADYGGRSGTPCSLITAGGSTTRPGVDPDFNGGVPFHGLALMDSHPVVAPNGDRSIGGYDDGTVFEGIGGYDARGWGVTFTRDGSVRAVNGTHWWEVTPSVWEHDGTFSYFLDQQRYSLFELNVSRLSPTMAVEAQGGLKHPDVDQDFRDANVVFGPTGQYYGVGGDGFLYHFDSNGTALDRIGLPDDAGHPNTMVTLSGYTARAADGSIFASYAGRVYVIGPWTPGAKLVTDVVSAAPRHRPIRGLAE